MPELRRLSGIVTKTQLRDTGRHGRPHVRVCFGEHKASVGLDGELPAGSLPAKQLGMVGGWLAPHESEVCEAWNNAVAGRAFPKIRPLRQGDAMFVRDGVAYAGESSADILVGTARCVGDSQMLVTSSTGETRLLDAYDLLGMPASAALEDEGALAAFEVADGVLCWEGGDMDIAPEGPYELTYEYVSPPIAV